MHRIDTKTAQKDKFGAGKNGFTRGNPQTGTPATDLDDDYFDMLQEELCSVVEASGASLEKTRHDQLLTALRALLLSRNNPFGDIKSDGTVKTALENLGLGDGTGRLIAVYRIDTSRQITLPKDARFVVADLIGGGGGGGSNSTTVQPGYASAGQGGNSGSRVVAKFTVDASQKINITIGAGGAGGVPTPATGANGSDGGATIIDGITATGGRGGAKGAAFNVLPTGGPTASPNANNTIPGRAELIAQHIGYGGNSGFLFSDKNALGGKGADSEFGVGGVAIGISSGVNASAGNNARGNGSGGSGAVSVYGSGSTGVSMSGGAGADGLAILWVYG
ncbi:TPA: hypothetical protein R1B06_001455 [Escherichia coli]|nr:hypothetical protein [Escherichia coli]EHR7903034.1 hypothetical protein [Escherichia coli]HCP5987559.1 hypothetical protein [Escherichia coli]HDW3179012.1 hypothetical protein [Escherichia coli]HDW4047131.1 hypothetical protein [Escherichia coli]